MCMGSMDARLLRRFINSLVGRRITLLVIQILVVLFQWQVIT